MNGVNALAFLWQLSRFTFGDVLLDVIVIHIESDIAVVDPEFSSPQNLVVAFGVVLDSN